MLQPHHRGFVRCTLDSESVVSTFSQLALIVACQVSNKGSDATGRDDVQLGASLFAKAVKELDPKRRTDVWEKAARFAIMQSLVLHTMKHLSTYYMENSFYDYAGNIPTNVWTPHWRLRLEIFEV